MPRASLIRLISWCFIAVAISAAVFAGTNYAYDISAQSELASAWDSSHHSVAAVPAPTASASGVFGSAFQVQRPRLAIGQPLAKMSVPSVGFSGIVLEGSDDRVLSGGPGHLVGTAYPGEPDNVVISNHNTYSMQFSKLKVGDQVILETGYGKFTYRVTGFRIIDKNDRSVTNHTGKANLTFTTCYPLYLGAFAAQRYVISADQVQA